MREWNNFINGQWRAALSGKTFENENPSDIQVPLGRFQASGPEDIALAVESAEAAFDSWRRVPLVERQNRVARFLELLDQQRGDLAEIVSKENGKTLREADAEVGSAIVEGSYHLRQVSTFSGNHTSNGGEDWTGWTQYHPLGVVGIISPWNFPMNVMCRKALPALLTGNTVVFKPAPYTPWSAVFMAGLFESAGFPPGVFNCVTGEGAAPGEALVGDPRVRAVSFTGSTAVGKLIQQQAAGRLVRTQLELGGKSALIVMEDADLDAALDAVMTAGFACSGQWCTSTSRLLLQKGIADAFLESVIQRCDQLVVGDPLDERTDMGPVAGSGQYEKIRSHIETASAEGAERLTGGTVAGAFAEGGYYIRPTVFNNVTPDMRLFREEVFGPVLAATTFETLEDAIRLSNSSDYALSSGIFTRDMNQARRYIHEVEAGLAHVNIHTGFKDPSLPFGGWKDSGSGPPENGRPGLEFFVEQKAVYLKS